MSEEQLPTAKQMEEVMLQKEAASKPEGHILDTYAGFFQIYGPVFNRYLESLNKKALIRVMKLLVKYPLEEEHLKALNRIERDLLKIGDQLLVSKYTMIIHSFAEMAKKQQELEKIQKEGENNG